MSRARTDRDALHFEAVEFARTRLPADLRHPMRDALMGKIVQMLMAKADLSAETAETMAAHAIGEVESSRTGLRIDLDRSTSSTVFVFDPAQGITRAITAAHLLHLLRLDADTVVLRGGMTAPRTDAGRLTAANLS
jgi:hypothetical protein